MSLTLPELIEFLEAIEFAYPAKLFCEKDHQSSYGPHVHVQIGVQVHVFWSKDNKPLAGTGSAVPQKFEVVQIVPLDYLDTEDRALDYVRHLLRECLVAAADEGIFVQGCQPFAKHL